MGACYCQNCAWVGDESDTDVIQHLEQRVFPGEPMPCGECPECGSLCQLGSEAQPMETVTVNCPHCGSGDLAEVREEITATRISAWAYDPNTDEVIAEDVVEQETYDTEVIRYECGSCNKDLTAAELVVAINGVDRKQWQANREKVRAALGK